MIVETYDSWMHAKHCGFDVLWEWLVIAGAQTVIVCCVW